VITGSQVFVNGTARGTFKLEVGAGRAPQDWSLVNREPLARQGSLLGVWQTDGIPAGPYTLRLSVTTPEGIIAEATQVLTYTDTTRRSNEADDAQ
jgi:hypothetical protein